MGTPDVSRHLEEDKGCVRWYRARGGSQLLPELSTDDRLYAVTHQ